MDDAYLAQAEAERSASRATERDSRDDDVSNGCQSCGGHMVPMGVLGRRAHYRCRSCGDEASHRLDNESYNHYFED